jgi:hypothetical protein
MNKRSILERFTSRPFLVTLGGSASAIGLAVAALTTPGLAPADRVQALIGGLVAVATICGVFVHSETKRDSAADVANIAASAQTTSALLAAGVTSAQAPGVIDHANAG